MPKLNPSNSVLIEVEKLSFGYPKALGKALGKKSAIEPHSIINDASFKIVAGDFIALLGPNGAGKTTLIKILLNSLTPTAGKINTFIRRTEIGYTPQNYQISELFPGTVSELLYSSKADLSAIELANIMPTELNLNPLLKEKFVTLSGGERQRVLIALSLLKSPKLLILDEPTAGIDIVKQQHFYELLSKLNQNGIAILLVTHEVGMVHKLVKKVLCINHQLCCIAELAEMPALLKKMYGSNFTVHHHH